MRELKLLHTADVHLDAPNRALGERASELRQRVRQTFAGIVQLCLQRQVQALIIAGDLFDSRRPARDTVDFAVTQLERLREATPPVQVFLLPGTHDCWAEGTVYAWPLWRNLPDHIHVLGGTHPSTVVLSHLDLAVHGMPHQCDLGGQQPLQQLRPAPEVALNVGVAHGSLERGDIQADASMFALPQIAATSMDYLALGHWHSWHDHSSGDVVAVNPGSPEVPGFGEWAQGAVAEVTLGEGLARVERLPVGELHATTVELDVSQLRSTTDLTEHLQELCEPRRLLDVVLRGLQRPGVVLDPVQAQEQLRGACFALRVRDDSHAPVTDFADAEVPDTLVLGRFLRLARERVEQAEDERARRVAEHALQLGLALLRGKEVV